MQPTCCSRACSHRSAGSLWTFVCSSATGAGQNCLLTYLHLDSCLDETQAAESVGLVPPGPCLPVLRELQLYFVCRHTVPLEQLLCGCHMPQLTELRITVRSPLTATELEGIGAISTLIKCVTTRPASVLTCCMHSDLECAPGFWFNVLLAGMPSALRMRIISTIYFTRVHSEVLLAYAHFRHNSSC